MLPGLNNSFNILHSQKSYWSITQLSRNDPFHVISSFMPPTGLGYLDKRRTQKVPGGFFDNFIGMQKDFK